MSWHFQGTSCFIVLCLSCLFFELMTFINQRLERDPKCKPFSSLLKALSSWPLTNAQADMTLTSQLWCYSSVPGDRVCCFFRKETGILFSKSQSGLISQAGDWSVWWLCDSGHAGGAGSSIERQEAQVAPGAQAMTHSRKEARAGWADWAENANEKICQTVHELKGNYAFHLSNQPPETFHQNKEINLHLNNFHYKAMERAK